MQIVPKLLRLTWFGFPLHHSKTGKWGFLVKRPPTGAHNETHRILDEEDESETNESDCISSADASPKFPYQYGPTN